MIDFLNVLETSVMETKFHFLFLAPTGGQVRNRISALSHVGYEVEWTAHEVGTHMVTMEYAGQMIGNGPAPVKAYDPTKVKVSDINNGFVGKPVTFIGAALRMFAFPQFIPECLVGQTNRTS